MRVVLLTADGRRHRYAAHRLAATVELAGVVSEGKAPAIVEGAAAAPADQTVLEQHLAERDAVEAALLGERPDFPAVPVLRVEQGGVNTPAVYDWVVGLAPTLIVLYGTSILRAPLLTAFRDRLVNLHLGLSPYYRGSGTNFWPLVNNEPEFVGATLHLAVSRVDAGAILAQVRPSVAADDRCHEIGTKALIAALDRLPEVLQAYDAGQLVPVTQDLTGGRLYRRADFKADAVHQLWARFDAGMMPRYLDDIARRCAAVPIVEGAR